MVDTVESGCGRLRYQYFTTALCEETEKGFDFFTRPDEMEGSAKELGVRYSRDEWLGMYRRAK